ncbi:hypothetical protein ACO2Q0_06285 [Phenylobacterium sp. VNQ135]|uniref:hypothetical protein n=1 Tax=Phenylobacterium sp. VNQ135 TaxID=3400922 RepID=UPI003C0AD93C
MAAGLLGGALTYQIFFGFRVGEDAGERAELIVASALVLAMPAAFYGLAKRRTWAAMALAFCSAFILWQADVRFSTGLDAQYGGAYGWTSERIAVLSWLLGLPVAGVAACNVVLTVLLGRFLDRRQKLPA